MHSALSLILWLILCFATAGIGSIPTAKALSTWYPTLRKPSWNPPSWLFAPVWTTLYALMGIAVWIVTRTDGSSNSAAIMLFVLQLFLNGLWSWIFFGWKSPGAALAEIIVLWISIGATSIAFAHWSTFAAALMVPYLAWVTFASCLNFAIWRLNYPKRLYTS